MGLLPGPPARRLRRVGGALALLALAACSGGETSTLEFEGSSCAYDGSAEIHEALRLTFSNRSDEATSAVVFRIAGSTDLADLEAAALADQATAILGGGFMDVPSLRRIEVGAGESGEFDRALEPGRWVIACVTSPTGTDRMYPAAVVDVSSGR